jgi:hypothetical protein
VKPLETEIEALELPVHQHRDAAVLGNLEDPLHLRGVAGDAELLLGNHDGPPLEILLDLCSCIVEIGNLVRGKPVLGGVRAGELPAGLVSQRFGFEGVRCSVVGGGPVDGTSSRQQHGGRHTHGALVCKQDGIRAAAVVEMLMNVDDRLARRRLPLHGRTEERQT